MIRHAIGCMLLGALLAVPAAAAENNSPKLTKETRDGTQITKKNITKMKLKALIVKRQQSVTGDLML